MRILHVHNYYTGSGGEDTVFHNTMRLLRSKGHEVFEYLEYNNKIASMSKVSVALQTIWSYSSYRKLMDFLQEVKPEVVHFHNTFPLISPSAYYACQDLGIPVVQRLHNQRLICPASSFYRDGKLCIECLGKTPPWPSVLHACYHDSRVQTSVISSMLTVHHWLGTWQTKVDAFLCSTDFYRNLFVQAGFPSEKIVLLPFSVEQHTKPVSVKRTGKYALYVGRLDPEKGVNTLLDAWRYLDIPLKIRGNGRLEGKARNFVSQHCLDNIEFLERMDADELLDLIGNARFLIMPSEGYYETFGLVIIEAYSRGTPVVASNIGVVPELVEDKKTGLLFEAGNAVDLAEKARWMWNHPNDADTMGRNCQNTFQERFTQDQYYITLIGVYERVVNSK